MEPRMVSRKVLAKLLSCSPQTLWRIEKERGLMPSVRVRSRLRYDLDAVLTWLGGGLEKPAEQLQPEEHPKRERTSKRARKGEPDLSLCARVVQLS